MKMAIFGFLASLVLVTNGHTSSPPIVECVNVGQTIRINQPNAFLRAKFLDVLVNKYDAQHEPKDQFQQFKFDDLQVTETEQTALAHEKRGCTTRDVYSVKMTFARKDNVRMPDAYNRLANEDGTLSDYFLCTRSFAWMAHPGRGCQ